MLLAGPALCIDKGNNVKDTDDYYEYDDHYYLDDDYYYDDDVYENNNKVRPNE